MRISPLEDTIVALRPIAPTPDSLPWELPNSIRPLEPALPINSTLGFTNLDPLGNAIAVTNQLTNFGWEYIWHCHILSHEEHDMMRAIAFAVPPAAPVLTGAIAGSGGNRSVVLNWTGSLVATSFTLEKAANAAFTQNKVTIPMGSLRTYTDKIGSSLTPIYYRVSAANTVGSEVAGYPTITAESKYSNTFGANLFPPAAPTNLVLTMQSGPQVRLNWTDNASNETGFVIERRLNGGQFEVLATTGPSNGGTTYTDGSGLAAGATYSYRLKAINDVGSSAYSNTATISLTAPNAPANVAVTAVRTGGSARVTLTWTDTSNNETGFVVQRATDSAFTTGLVETGVNANAVTFSETVSRGVNFYYRILAENPLGRSAWVNASPFPIRTP